MTGGQETGRRLSGRPRERIPLNTLAVPFGAAGLAGAWSTATPLLRLPSAIAAALWIAAAVAWVWLIAAHLARGARSGQRLAAQLMHPAQGPIAALVPVVGMLLGARLHAVWPVGGTLVVLASLVVSALLAAWITGFWLTGRLVPDAFHGGYLLPTVGAGFVAATATAQLGLRGLSMGAFAVGAFFWVVLLTVLIARLALLPPLPDALKPTLAILLAPPAVGGIAWFAMRGRHPDAVSSGLLALTVLMVLVQLALVPDYRRLRFTLGFWSFTFPACAAAGYGVAWAALAGFPLWQAVAWVLLAAATVLVVVIALKSVVLVAGSRLGGLRAEQQLRRADDSVLRRRPRLPKAKETEPRPLV